MTNLEVSGRISPSVVNNRQILTNMPKLLRHHIPTGNISFGKWTGAQHWMLSDPEAHSARKIREVCESLVTNWNAEHPTIWHYTLEYPV